MSSSPSKILEVFDNPNVECELRNEEWSLIEVVRV